MWDMEESEIEKKGINHITHEILKKLQKITPNSNVIQHRKSSAIDLFLVPEDIVWNEGATQTGRGCGAKWVNKHE